MATQTSHYHFIKPDLSDNADITVIGTDMEMIDTEIYNLNQKFPSVPLGISKGGTNATTAAAARTQLGAAGIMITADMGTVSALPVTKTVTGVTSDMKVCGYELGNPTAFATNLTVTTADGSVTLSGTLRQDNSGDNYTSTVKIRLTNNTNKTGS